MPTPWSARLVVNPYFLQWLDQSQKMFVDAATGGALMGKSNEAAKALLEEMASNNNHWSSE